MNRSAVVLCWIGLTVRGSLAQTASELPCRNPSGAWARNGVTSYLGVGTDTDGNVYAAGTFGGMRDFDPGPEEDWHTAEWNNFGSGVFLTRTNADGSYGWTRSFNAYMAGNVGAVAVHSDSTILVGGNFRGGVDFDPSETTHVLLAGPGVCGFLSRFTATGEYLGATVVARPLPTTSVHRNSFVNALSVALDGSIYTAGGIDGAVDFDPGPAEDLGAGNSNAFVSKFDSDFTYGWSRHWGTNNAFDAAESVAIDTLGDVYVAGHFRSSVDFDPGPGEEIHSTNMPGATFITKYHADGDYAWTRSYKIVPLAQSPLTVGSDGAIWLGGAYDDEYNNPVIDFDPTSGFELVQAEEHLQPFVTRLFPDGSYGGTFFFSSTDTSEVYGVRADSANGVIVMGRFRGIVDFDPGPSTHFVVAGGLDDLFLTRLSVGGEWAWTRTAGEWQIRGSALAVGPDDLITVCGTIEGPTDLDVGCAVQMLGSVDDSGSEAFLLRMGCTEPAADANTDGAVDLRDAAAFAACFSGEGSPEQPTVCPSGCYNFDFDGDDDIDAADFATFGHSLTGPH